MSSPSEARVLVLPATRRDGAVTCDLLRRAGLQCAVVDDAAALAKEIAGPVGAIIITDIALGSSSFGQVLEALAQQPAWSDIPAILMSRANEVGGAESVAAVVDRLTNVTVIDRPTSVRTLLSAVQAALRARRRQYQIRDQLAALRQADEALRLADRRKDEFLATLAHELRNPLAPLRSALQILELRGTQDEQQARLVAMMERQMTVMVRLIDDLLDIARISSGKVVLQRQRLDIRTIIESAVESAQPGVEAARHRLTVSLPEAPALVMGDATRLAQVIGNLLNNAAKYTPPGGHLELAVSLQDESVVIQVTDDGVGIPANLIGQVFDMFAQVNRTLDRAQGGLGIGLSLVRRLLTMHGGTVEAASEGIDKGSTFTVKLPRLPDDVAAVPDPAGAPDGRGPPIRRLRMVVVDDSRDAADSLALLLGVGGHDVQVAYNGPDALAVVAQHRPNVVFCDLGMQGMSGHEVASALRADPRHATAMLVAVTGWGTDADKSRAQEAGFDFHLVKPVDSRAIAGVLERL